MVGAMLGRKRMQRGMQRTRMGMGMGKELRRKHGYWPSTKTRKRNSGNFNERTHRFASFLYAFQINVEYIRIATNGSSSYLLNSRSVTYQTYSQTLASHNILTKARNFLVFQGDVEAVASQSPLALSKLIDQISGSLELKGEYESAKEEMEKATDRATENFGKRRGIVGEIRSYREQKGEVEKFEGLVQERDNIILQRLLHRLYHISESISTTTEAIHAQNKELVSLRKEQREKEKELEKARKEQAAARGAVMKSEGKVKKGEKAVEAKVTLSIPCL